MDAIAQDQAAGVTLSRIWDMGFGSRGAISMDSSQSRRRVLDRYGGDLVPFLGVVDTLAWL